MRAARVGFERILPEEFESIENNPVYKVKNCQCLEYSRFNPFTGQDEGKIKWRRITNPTEPETSPDGGNWIELRGKPKVSSNEILEKIEKDAPNLSENVNIALANEQGQLVANRFGDDPIAVQYTILNNSKSMGTLKI